MGDSALTLNMEINSSCLGAISAQVLEIGLTRLVIFTMFKDLSLVGFKHD